MFSEAKVLVKTTKHGGISTYFGYSFYPKIQGLYKIINEP